MKLRSPSLSVRWLLAIVLLSANAGAQGAEQPPTVRSFVINGGAPQRSMVTSIVILFSADVGASLQAGDLHITNLTMNTALTGAQFTYSAATRTGTWTFPAEFGKSLPDGNYLAFLRPADVVGPTGLQLVPNAGSTTWSTKFFRYFGDFDGDRDVDFLDTAKMRETNGKKFRQHDFNPAADVNDDGKIDDTDLGAFKEHYLSILSGQTFAPVIVGAPVRTSQQTITIHGKAAPNTRVIITNGFLTFEGMSDENGDFAIVVGLLSNRINSLFVAGEGFSMTDFSALTPVTITQDSTPPFLYVDSPADQSTVDTPAVTVTGRVGDLLSGFDGLTVKVNQVNANITAGIGPNGTFEAENIPLAMGENFLAVIATDGLGTSVTKSVMVTRVAQLQMGIVSGNDQTAVRNSELPAPLVVGVRDTNGQPFANKIVNFQVTRSDGHVSPTQGQTTLTGPMLAQARTDAQGLARTYWRLGSDSGKSNNLLIATSAGVPGQASFRASADPRPPTQINVGMGNNQIGEAGGVAPVPLTAWASDNLNGAPNIPVTFTVTSGDAKVAAKDQVNAAASVAILTDSTGHVDAYLHFGSTGGPVTVEATFPGLQSNPAVFIARALVRKPGQPASFNAVVQDNTGLAIGGATCTLNINGIKLPAVISDANGFFSFPNVNPGAGFVQIDGRTANKLGGKALNEPGRFPSLVYRIAIVPNAENPLPTTVYLPTLNPANERSYDGTKDVDLTIERIAGLKMTIKAGSMTLADGTKPTAAKPVTVSLNQVHADNIPMPIQDGVAPLLTWTLQPPGAHFDPPVAIQYPNMTGLVPGSFTNFLSYNHDIERFEIVASGTVSADGSVINTDPGVGLLNSGWGCNCPPYSATADCASCSVKISGPRLVCQNSTVSYSAILQGTKNPKWSLRGGGTLVANGSSATIKFSNSTEPYELSLTAECKDGSVKSDRRPISPLEPSPLPSVTRKGSSHIEEADFILFEIPEIAVDYSVKLTSKLECCSQNGQDAHRVCYAKGSGTLNGSVPGISFPVPGAGTLVKLIDKVVCEKILEKVPLGNPKCDVGITISTGRISIDGSLAVEYDECLAREDWAGSNGKLTIADVKLAGTLSAGVTILGTEINIGASLQGTDRVTGSYTASGTKINFNVSNQGPSIGLIIELPIFGKIPIETGSITSASETTKFTVSTPSIKFCD